MRIKFNINNHMGKRKKEMLTTEKILAPFTAGKLDLLMITPSLILVPDPANGRLRSPSLAIGYILANVKKEGFNVKYIDMDACLIPVEKLLKYIDKNKPRLIGLTAVTINVKLAAEVAGLIKKSHPEIPICLGGIHATMVPRETLKEFPCFDFLVCGEGELVVPKVLEELKKPKPNLKSIKGVITRDKKEIDFWLVENIDDLPYPAWEEFDLFRYPGVDLHRTNRELPLITARGCPFDCCFCCRPPGYRKVRYRSIENIMKEIIHNLKEFDMEATLFTDETFTANKQIVSGICKAILDSGLNKKMRWSCSTRVDIVDYKIFKLMKKAGCYDTFFGFESGDNRILKIAGKRITTADMERAVKIAKKVGIAVHGCFILNLPGETEKTIEKAWKLAKKLDVRGISFPIAVPFPGTRLRAMAERGEYGLRIIGNNWDDYGKQYPGVMEQGNLNMERLLYIQQKSYLHHPIKWNWKWPEDELDRSKKATIVMR